MRHLFPLCLAFTAALASAQPKDFPGIEQLMSPEDFRAAGLDKLSPAEREALNRWLVGYTAGEAQALRESSEEVKQAEQDIRIEAEVKGDFSGWSGDTLFPLDNGQLWRQRLDGRFPYSGSDRRVVIEKNFFGFFRLTHVESGKSIGVTRVNQ
ncbi:hypothetical protein [Parahaliea aestuarii]|uniref:Uncharacterized protein n=1 Tax=Parahaliea aestuarii TaxID=1852021 RepID=A0A5C8ZUP3_9GAMM|nr:hypothetical protein [Parahaliea aestuarii]TXS92233.1 hypothetical protein FVW59_07340 [Parahaliea aestuarii]